MKLKKIIVAVTTLGIVGLLSACHPGHRADPEEKLEWVVSKATKKLDLNEEQQGKLKTVGNLFLETRKNGPSKEERIKTIKSMILADEITSEQLLNHMEEKKKRIEEAAPRIADAIVELHASLEQEQKEKLVEHLEDLPFFKH